MSVRLVVLSALSAVSALPAAALAQERQPVSRPRIFIDNQEPQVIREPLEGVSPSLFIWSVTVGLTAVGFLVSLLFFSRFRNRIVYWL